MGPIFTKSTKSIQFTQTQSNAQIYDEIFCDLHEPLDFKQAQIDSSRCYYCYDAPCIKACPTQIDIPSFIRKISNHNTKGAALDILSSNIMGGTCARACPVEVLCQQACVRNTEHDKPVQIGTLQRFAIDEYLIRGEKPFKQGLLLGKTVAVVGAGPAGLACAHELSILGYNVTVFEAQPKPGGLNEYGLAPYKMTSNFAQKEVDFILGVGGIQIQYSKRLGVDFSLSQIQSQYAAVFLGVGLSSNRNLDIPGEFLPGVMDATQMIKTIRQTQDIKSIEVSKDVVVIGAGNTAIDIAVQMKRLGAENVTLVYRRGRKEMGATTYEQEVAQTHGVLIKTWLIPIKIESYATTANAQIGLKIQFERSELSKLGDGRLVGAGTYFSIVAGQIFKAIGQTLNIPTSSFPELKTSKGKWMVNENFETSLKGVFAGGDCILTGEDLTVTAVAHGKKSAHSIHQYLNK